MAQLVGGGAVNCKNLPPQYSVVHARHSYAAANPMPGQVRNENFADALQ